MDIRGVMPLPPRPAAGDATTGVRRQRERTGRPSTCRVSPARRCPLSQPDTRPSGNPFDDDIHLLGLLHRTGDRIRPAVLLAINGHHNGEEHAGRKAIGWPSGRARTTRMASGVSTTSTTLNEEGCRDHASDCRRRRPPGLERPEGLFLTTR